MNGSTRKRIKRQQERIQQLAKREKAIERRRKAMVGSPVAQPKIFGVGLTRTGTQSLAKAFNLLGYRFIHQPLENVLFAGRYQGACDVVVAIHYKKLDRKFPNSKFILTIRNKDDWLESMKAHFSKPRANLPGGSPNPEPLRVAMYGQKTFDKKAF